MVRQEDEESGDTIPARLGYVCVETLYNETETPDGAPRDTMIWRLARER